MGSSSRTRGLLEVTASRVKLDLLDPEALPAVALRAIEGGLESPSLIDLAGLTSGESRQARALFERSLEELAIELPTKHRAVLNVARGIACQIVRGETTPFDGAAQISDLTDSVDEAVPELDSFVYAASEWEDRPEDQPIFIEGVMQAAADLIGEQTEE